jgi:hypothetical protein
VLWAELLLQMLFYFFTYALFLTKENIGWSHQGIKCLKGRVEKSEISQTVLS